MYARFHIDVGCGDAHLGKPERLVGDDLLAFAGIDPATVFAISKAQQFAEKVHAYTFPWVGRLNTRTKDLVDLVLLIDRGLLEVENIRTALEATFTTWATHPLPKALLPPPKQWAIEFSGMAAEAGLSSPEYLDAFAILERFWTSNALGSIGRG